MPHRAICVRFGARPTADRRPDLRAGTVTLDPPAAPRITRALGLLIEEINAAPPRMPGDTRPITYQLAAHPRI